MKNKKMRTLHDATSMDDLTDAAVELVSYMSNILEEYEVPPALMNNTIIILVDFLKSFAGEYHRLIVEGKIPQDKQYQHNPKKAMEVYNKEKS